MAKKLWNADAAMAEAAIQAGCRFFAGYPITPATEILEHFAARMPEVGGVFIQAESELASINMVAGAAGTGTRSMTATAGQGFDLMQEGMQHSVAAELPFVVGQLSRVGPGGNLQPYQGDYFQATRGGAHGGYHIPVYAPATVGETVDFTQKAFYIADKYRTPVEILAEGILGHTIEPAEIGTPVEGPLPEKNWTTTGALGRPPRLISYAVGRSRYGTPEGYKQGMGMGAEASEEFLVYLREKWNTIERNEVMVETIETAECDVALVAYGTTGRICRTVVEEGRAKGIKVGLVRPLTLWPFPSQVISDLADRKVTFLDVEMCMGQMVEDVKLIVLGRTPVHFYGRLGGVVPTWEEILEQVEKLANGPIRPKSSDRIGPPRIGGKEKS